MINREEQKGKKISILGFAGSLRKDSFNKSLLRAAQEVLPGDVELEIFDLEGISPFNQDLENQPSAYSADSATRFRRNPPPCSDSSRQGVPIDSTTPGRSVATLVF